VRGLGVLAVVRRCVCRRGGLQIVTIHDVLLREYSGGGMSGSNRCAATAL
jgi:hypothetical protein